MLASFPCQRKMQPDYPSVAKPCTPLPVKLESTPLPGGRRAGVKSQCKLPTLTALALPTPGVNAVSQGLTPAPPSVWVLTQDLAPRMLEMLG